jgi:hypothetical protein
MSDLLPATKKAYYEQEGKQFMYESAWMLLKDSSKWQIMSQTRTNPQESPSNSLPLDLSNQSTPALQPSELPANNTSGVDSNGSWKDPWEFTQQKG